MAVSKSLLLGIVVCLICTASNNRVYDPCKIFGTVYVEDNPSFAHFRVYEEETEAFADVLIFEETNRLYADREGLWSFTDKREFADVIIYWEEERGLADFTVFFTDFESFAGCNR